MASWKTKEKRKQNNSTSTERKQETEDNQIDLVYRTEHKRGTSIDFSNKIESSQMATIYKGTRSNVRSRRITISIFLLLLLFLTATNRGGVDGFVQPRTISISNKLATAPTVAELSQSGTRTRRDLHFSSNRQSGKTKTSTTQLGITVVLPLPLAGPRLSGAMLRVAESWAPLVGVLTSTLLYLAPLRAVWASIRRARYQTFEGDDPMYGLNPLPIAILPSVALSWLVYGLAASDPYLIMGNLPGLLLSIFYLIGILPLMNYNAAEFPTLPNIPNMPNLGNASNDQNQITEKPSTENVRRKPKKSRKLILTQAAVLLSAASTMGLWALLGLMTAGATNGLYNIGGLEFGMGFSSMLRSGVIVQSLGVYAASLFLILSATPLTTIRTILRTKNSQTILGPFTAAQCVNTGLWTAYGVAVNDHFVWGPNIIVSARSIEFCSRVRGPACTRNCFRFVCHVLLMPCLQIHVLFRRISFLHLILATFLYRVSVLDSFSWLSK